MVQLPEGFDAEAVWKRLESESLEREGAFQKAIELERRLRAGDLKPDFSHNDAARLIESTNALLMWMSFETFSKSYLFDAPQSVSEALRRRVEDWRRRNPADPNHRSPEPRRYEYTSAILLAHLYRTTRRS